MASEGGGGGGGGCRAIVQTRNPYDVAVGTRLALGHIETLTIPPPHLYDVAVCTILGPWHTHCGGGLRASARVCGGAMGVCLKTRGLARGSPPLLAPPVRPPKHASSVAP